MFSACVAKLAKSVPDRTLASSRDNACVPASSHDNACAAFAMQDYPKIHVVDSGAGKSLSSSGPRGDQVPYKTDKAMLVSNASGMVYSD